MSRPLTITVEVEVTIDAEAWAREYGLDLEDVEDDVRAWVREQSVEGVHALGLAAFIPRGVPA